MAQWRLAALLFLGGLTSACGVRGNPRPPLPDVHPSGVQDAGPRGTAVPAPDAGPVGPAAPSPDGGVRVVPRAPVDS